MWSISLSTIYLSNLISSITWSITWRSPYHIVGRFAASDWLFTKVYELLSPLGLNIVHPENNLWVLFKVKTTVPFILKKKQSCFGWHDFILPRPAWHFVRTRVSKVTYGSFCNILYDPRDPDHRSRSHKVYSLVSGEERISGASIKKTKSELFNYFSQKYAINKFLFVEYTSFGDEGI